MRTKLAALTFVVALFAGTAGAQTIIVTNANDSGVGSLRAAVASATSAETIIFDAAFFSVPRTITLTSGEIGVNTACTIVGPGANQLTISGNNASRVFSFTGGDFELRGMTIANGLATDGGGISCVGSPIRLSFCRITGCVASGSGGGVFLQNAGGSPTATIEHCCIDSNSAMTGGGLALSGSGFTYGFRVTQTTVSGNSAANGGGISFVATGGSPKFYATYCTVTQNAATGQGGGLYASAFVEPYCGGCVIAGNTAAAGPDGFGVAPNFIRLGAFFITGDFYSAGYNLIGIDDGGGSFVVFPANVVGTSVSPINALLGPLQNNGGPTPTHALLVGSPAIDLTAATTNYPFDQRGFLRGVLPDAGAYESNSPGTGPPGPQGPPGSNGANGQDGADGGCTTGSSTSPLALMLLLSALAIGFWRRRTRPS